MELKKRSTTELEKCYCVAMLHYKNEKHLVVAAEKVNKCLLFDLQGNLQETIWEGPGGTMSIVQAPGSDGAFFATQRFYSPNDSAEAEIVYAAPKKNGWQVKTAAKLPFVHRIGILKRNNRSYMIACTLKSGHAYKDDWTSPGKIWVADIPENLEELMENRLPIKFTVLQDGLTRNHGFYQGKNEAGEYALVGSENGILKLEPPDEPDGEWKREILTEDPASDMVLADLDEDGEPELVVITPFHGDTLKIYQKQHGRYVLAETCPEKLEFAHAIWSGKIHGRPAVLLGHRKGEQAILTLTCEKNSYCYTKLAVNAGSANMLAYNQNGREYLLSANRETDEIAFYEIV